MLFMCRSGDEQCGRLSYCEVVRTYNDIDTDIARLLSGKKLYKFRIVVSIVLVLLQAGVPYKPWRVASGEWRAASLIMSSVYTCR